jgi:hypothetical protein
MRTQDIFIYKPATVIGKTKFRRCNTMVCLSRRTRQRPTSSLTKRQHLIVLDGLLPQLDLTGIDACFTEAEIWVAIKDMPPDRAPGPDGFCGRFYRVAWEVIKHDIVCAFNALWSLDARSFHLLNDALMIWLRKNAAPSRPKDFRPISLMHGFSKLFAKCLARRLAPRLHDIVAQNQSAFIKARAIHDNFHSVQLSCRWLHSKQHASVLVKIDIAKAFDSVAWPFLLDVLRHIGFPRRWTNWISILLSTASTKVLMNGRPGQRIAHAVSQEAEPFHGAAACRRRCRQDPDLEGRLAHERR